MPCPCFLFVLPYSLFELLFLLLLPFTLSVILVFRFSFRIFLLLLAVLLGFLNASNIGVDIRTSC